MEFLKKGLNKVLGTLEEIPRNGLFIAEQWALAK